MLEFDQFGMGAHNLLTTTDGAGAVLDFDQFSVGAHNQLTTADGVGAMRARGALPQVLAPPQDVPHLPHEDLLRRRSRHRRVISVLKKPYRGTSLTRKRRRGCQRRVELRTHSYSGHLTGVPRP